jgi:hypothetical protein
LGSCHTATQRRAALSEQDTIVEGVAVFGNAGAGNLPFAYVVALMETSSAGLSSGKRVSPPLAQQLDQIRPNAAIKPTVT